MRLRIEYIYDTECARIDAPKENMCFWLERNAIKAAWDRYNKVAYVFKSGLLKREREGVVFDVFYAELVI